MIIKSNHNNTIITVNLKGFELFFDISGDDPVIELADYNDETVTVYKADETHELDKRPD